MNNIEKKETCQDRILESFASMNEELARLQDKEDYDDYFDDPALSVDTYQITKVCFSYGGPSSFLEIIHNGPEVHSMTYRFSDWFDTATMTVTPEDAMWTYGASVVECL